MKMTLTTKKLRVWIMAGALVAGTVTAVTAESASAYDHRYGRIRDISTSYATKTYNESFTVKCVSAKKTITFTVSNTWKRLGSSQAQHLKSQVTAKSFGAGQLVLRTAFLGNGKHSNTNTAYLKAGHLSQSWNNSGKYTPFKGSRNLGQFQVDASYLYNVSSTDCIPMQTVVVQFNLPKT